MKILLLGASGMVGSRILAEAAGRGHEVIAAARSPEKIAQFPGVTPVKADAHDAATFAGYAAGADLVIGAVSPRNGGDALAEATAYAEALIAAKPKRVIMVGGAGSLSLPDGTPVVNVLPQEYVAEARGMKAAWDLLAQSGLKWTVLAPSAQIAPGERTGDYTVGGTTLLSDSKGNSHISAEDFADAVINEAEQNALVGRLATVGYTG